MQEHIDQQEVPVIYNRCFREYGIRILDGGSAVQLIDFCPWCGKQLPSSLRDLWFERLRALGLEPGDSKIPDEMMTDAWWRE
jgi:hypothetical protein